jgi:hypothetical protein
MGSTMMPEQLLLHLHLSAWYSLGLKEASMFPSSLGYNETNLIPFRSYCSIFHRIVFS